MIKIKSTDRMTDLEVREALKKGEKRKVIENYIYLARDVMRYVNRKNYFQDPDDMFSVALLALVTGVYKIPEGHPEPGKYFWTRMHYHVLNFCKRNHVIKPPDSGQLIKFSLNATEEAALRVLNFEEYDGGSSSRLTSYLSYIPSNPYERLMKSIALTEWEKKIIDHRLEGKSITEIAKILGTNFVRIQRALENMKSRVVRILDGDL